MTSPKQNNQSVMSDWHKLDCKQVTSDNPTCRCGELYHHVGAYAVALYLGLTKRRQSNA